MPDLHECRIAVVLVTEDAEYTTLEWLLRHEAVQRLFLFEKTEATKHFVWLRGPPKSGKSCAAAFLINELKKRYGERVAVAYYFFSSSRGMRSATDAVRALSYQLERQFSGFDMTPSANMPLERRPNIGLKLLMNKLLDPYLKQTRTNVVLILDGVDQADFEARDVVKVQADEMTLLFEYLAHLSDQKRVLIASRPFCIKHDNIPGRIISTVIDFEENSRAIEFCVERFFSKNPALQKMFEREGISDFDYFRRHGNGSVLWVQNALKDLSYIQDPVRA